jgi:hypothetical protein
VNNTYNLNDEEVTLIQKFTSLGLALKDHYNTDDAYKITRLLRKLGKKPLDIKISLVKEETVGNE